jgi:hypothetical protein
MSDVSFEQILAAQNSEFAQAEVYSTWMPPDGEYVVQVKKVTKGSSTEDAGPMPWWKMTGKILVEQDPKLKGAEFTIGFFNRKKYGMMKGAAQVISGKQVMDNLKEASDVILASEGKVLKVKVETRDTKRGKFTGCDIIQVIQTEGLGQATSESPATVATPA